MPDKQIVFSQHAKNRMQDSDGDWGTVDPALLLAGAIPPLADELRAGLMSAGPERLIPQVDRLRIIGYCNCGDGFCSKVITSAGGEPSDPSSMYGEDIDCRNDGMFIVHLDGNDNICQLEVLFRLDHTKRLVAAGL